MPGSPSGSISKDYSAPAPELEQILKNAESARPPESTAAPEKRGRGRPPGSSKKQLGGAEQPALTLTAEQVKLIVQVGVNILNSATKSEVWAFSDAGEEKTFCETMAYYFNLRSPEWTKKFAPEILVLTVLSAYAIPRFLQLKAQKDSLKPDVKTE